MRKTEDVIKKRIEGLEEDLENADPNDILSIQIIEADIMRLERLLDYAPRYA